MIAEKLVEENRKSPSKKSLFTQTMYLDIG